MPWIWKDKRARFLLLWIAPVQLTYIAWGSSHAMRWRVFSLAAYTCVLIYAGLAIRDWLRERRNRQQQTATRDVG